AVRADHRAAHVLPDPCGARPAGVPFRRDRRAASRSDRGVGQRKRQEDTVAVGKLCAPAADDLSSDRRRPGGVAGQWFGVVLGAGRSEGHGPVGTLRSRPGVASCPLRGPLTIIFLGSSFGNALYEERDTLLDEIARTLGPGGGFLVSADLDK